MNWLLNILLEQNDSKGSLYFTVLYEYIDHGHDLLDQFFFKSDQ
jgi:hypothetical protein